MTLCELMESLILCVYAKGGTPELLLRQVMCNIGTKDVLGISGSRVNGMHLIKLTTLCITTQAILACLGVHSHSHGSCQGVSRCLVPAYFIFQ